MKKLPLSELIGIKDGELQEILLREGYHPETVDKLRRVVNAHEELLALVKAYANHIALDGCACSDSKLCTQHETLAQAIAKAEGRQ